MQQLGGRQRGRAHGRHGRAAFTLVELLVVIAILTILMALLLPTLQRARETAFALQCVSNYKSIGLAIHAFAQEHAGRGPGRAHRAQPTGSSVSWVNILNAEFFEEANMVRTGQVREGKIGCPLTRHIAGTSIRPQAINRNAAGGPGWGGNPPEGPYGRALSAADFPEPFPSPKYDFYALGASLGRFTRPSRAFLVMEYERGADETYASWPYDLTLTQNSYGTVVGGPPTAFRHFAGQGITSEIRTVAVYVDCHAGTVPPEPCINKEDAWRF